jgi:PAS domain S-box-containing protein
MSDATSVTARDAPRQRALGRYVVLDSPREEMFDDLARLAQQLGGTAVAGICLVEGTRGWFKALVGLDLVECRVAETPFAHHLTDTDTDVIVVPDAALDERFAGLGWVTGEPRARFYAGAPLITADGYILGSIFCMDPRPRWGLADGGQALAALARQVVALLELRRTQLSYHTVVDGAGHVVFHLDTQHRLLSVTPTWARLTGYGVIRSLGRSLASFAHPEDRDRLAARLETTGRDGKASPVEWRLPTLLGQDVPVEMFAQPLLDELGRPVGLVGVLSDITERKARQIESQHVSKMESLGQMSAGLAHEINTPIQFVGDNTRFLAESCETMLTLLLAYRGVLDPDSAAMPWPERQQALQRAEDEADIDYLAAEIPSAVAQSLEGVERVASIVRAMKTFTHPGQDEQAAADLNEALHATATVARSQVKYVADVELDLGELPSVTCNIGELNQVFLNLIVNAADAIEETGTRGTIRVRTRADGDHAVVEVSDTGTGISDELRLKIFEPFFTTKEVGRGTGQGLALASAVIRDRHAGSISVASTRGAGSTFTIRLPIRGAREKGSGE